MYFVINYLRKDIITINSRFKISTWLLQKQNIVVKWINSSSIHLLIIIRKALIAIE